jgi:hypothetical protein
MLGFETWLRRDEITGRPKERGRIQQRGSGAKTLCGACNSQAGALYVPEFIQWTRRGQEALESLPLDLADATREPLYFDLRLERVQPARFLKQVVTMLLASALPGFASHRDHLDLSAFAQDPGWIGLPDRYQLYLALYCGPLARFNGGSGVLRLGEKEGESPSTAFVLEIAHPPFAYLLSVDEEAPIHPCGNISNLAWLGINQTCDFEIGLRVGFGHTPLPGDLRSRAAMLADRAENRRQAALERLWVPASARE